MATSDESNQALVFASKEELAGSVELSSQAISADTAASDQQLSAQADETVQRFLKLDLSNSQAQEQAKSAVEGMGLSLQKEAARRSAMLKQPLAKLMADSEDGGQVANSLVDLKTEVEELDPARIEFDAGWFSRMLGYLPGVGTPLKRYFSRYESASTTIDAIIKSLEIGREQLKRDNITLADDQTAMRELTHKLEKAISLGQLIDQRLQNAVDNEILQDDPRHKFISEELIFPLRQRIQDLQQQLLVNQQGFLTIEMVVRNNKELIRGVNRALNTTVGALQVAVTLAMALANQKIVLEKVQSINTTTENLIAGNAQRLKTQGAEIHKQASSTQLNIDVLKQSFADIHAALDDISRYRQEALPKMAADIIEMDQLAAESEQHIQRFENAERTAHDFPLEIID